VFELFPVVLLIRLEHLDHVLDQLLLGACLVLQQVTRLVGLQNLVLKCVICKLLIGQLRSSTIQIDSFTLRSWKQHLLSPKYHLLALQVLSWLLLLVLLVDMSPDWLLLQVTGVCLPVLIILINVSVRRHHHQPIIVCIYYLLSWLLFVCRIGVSFMLHQQCVVNNSMASQGVLIELILGASCIPFH